MDCTDDFCPIVKPNQSERVNYVSMQDLISDAVSKSITQNSEWIDKAVDRALAAHLSKTIRLSVNDQGFWVATSGDLQNYAIGIGNTPEEALAKLRLELKGAAGLTEVEQALTSR